MADTNSDAAQEWLNSRMQPGNWLDILPDDQIPIGITGWNRTILHMHQIAFAPEIRDRRSSGSLPADFHLWACQLIQPFEGGQEIRLNSEVRGVPFLRTKRELKRGDEVLLTDFDNLEVFDLDDDELDSGHFTIFWTGSSWVGSFDFRSGRSKCLDLLEKAFAFSSAARLSIENRLAEPAIDNLHTACELIAKSRLILSNREAVKWKSHGPIKSGINHMGKMGNIDISFVSLFNNLGQIRGHAKYATGFVPDLPLVDDVDLVEAMISDLKGSVEAKRYTNDHGQP